MPSDRWPRVGIVILNWNGSSDSIECLRSVLGISYPHYSVVVVDNGSSDDSVARIDAWLQRERSTRDRAGAVTVIANETNLGFSGGNNVGITHVLQNGAELVLLLNNDTIVAAGFLEPLVASCLAHERPGISGPYVYEHHEPSRLTPSGAGLQMSLWWGKPRPAPPSGTGAVTCECVTGAAMLIHRQVVDSIGLLDDRFFLYWEDMDYCLRARRAGFPVSCCPSSHVWHKVSASSGARRRLSAAQLYHLPRGRILLMRKHARWYQWMTFLPVLSYTIARRLAGIVIHERRLPFRPLMRILSALVNGFAVPSIDRAPATRRRHD